MALTLSQLYQILPPTRSGRTFFAASSLLGLCAFFQLSFLGWYFVHGGARTTVAVQAPAAPNIPRFLETMQPTVAPVDEQAVQIGPTVNDPADAPNQYATMPQPTPAPVQRLSGASSGDALEQARALRQRGDMRAALSRLRETLVADPDNAQAIAELALTYESMPDMEDKAFEQWQRIYNMGESIGALYQLADSKLHGGANAAATAKRAGSSTSADNTVLKITDITTEEIPDPSMEKKVALKIVVKSRPGVVIDPTKVRIDAYFYDLVDGTSIMQTDAQTDYAWLTPPPINWANDKSEVLEALYVRPKGVALMPGAPAGAAPNTTRTGSRRGTARNGRNKPAPDAADGQTASDDASAAASVRTYLGYSVRVYYGGELQEVKAEPVRLLQQFQAPPTLPADGSAAPDEMASPTEMKILVVDDQAETVGALAQGLRDATGHEVVEAVGGQQALDVSQAGGVPDVLVTEVVLDGVDGFALNESLRAARPDLLTIYVTGYDLTQYADYINGTPVFYKPADPREVAAALETAPAATVLAAVPAEPASETDDGKTVRSRSASLTDELPLDQRSQSSRLRNLVGKQGFTGKLDQFDLVDIIQMCCVSKRTGRLLIARRSERGVLYLRVGQIIQAVSGQLEGEEAAYEIIGWSNGQFSFEDGVQPETQTIMAGWEHLVMEGMRRRDERHHAETGGVAPDAADPKLAGKTIGPYELRRKIGQGERSEVFEAVQTSMGRVVALKILLPEFQADDQAVQTFLAQASAKANVQHPSILSVYEAGQSEGIYYYTREFVDGANLAYLHAQGRTVDDPTALQCIRVTAEALSFLNLQKIAHPPITPEDVYLGRDGRARLNNLAGLPDEKSPPTQHDIRSVSRMVSDCLPKTGATTPGLRALLGRMLLEGATGIQSWGALLQAVKALEPKVVPEDAFKLSAQDAAAIAAVNEAKRRQKRTLVWTTVGMFALVWLVGIVVWLKFFRAPAARDFNRMLPIPAGDFLFGPDKAKANTRAFWIDEYEVTIGQYAQFVAELKAHPTDKYEAPKAPKGHSHTNDKWDLLYAAAKDGGTLNKAPVDLNCPVVQIDWFDAYAYARWKGHRLPTEQEWEKAARGTNGQRFPWGDDATQIKLVNTSADYNDHDPGAKGLTDGYNRWSPVDVMTGDKSPYGVMDMAGNVSEWTETVEHQGLLDFPIVRGGNFGSDTFDATRRFDKLADQKFSDRVGFRTVSDTPPAAK